LFLDLSNKQKEIEVLRRTEVPTVLILLDRSAVLGPNSDATTFKSILNEYGKGGEVLGLVVG
jgi:hypothetical protein